MTGAISGSNESFEKPSVKRKRRAAAKQRKSARALKKRQVSTYRLKWRHP